MATRDPDPDEIMMARRFSAMARNAGADYLWVRQLDDGRALYLLPMLHGNTRLAIGEFGADSFDDGWCYRDTESDAAWRAVLGWDGEGEPDGWYRHPDTGRRRPDGTAASEVVYW